MGVLATGSDDVTVRFACILIAIGTWLCETRARTLAVDSQIFARHLTAIVLLLSFSASEESRGIGVISEHGLLLRPSRG